MLEHTIYIRQKQTAHKFIMPEWYNQLERVYRDGRSITYAARFLGLPESQVREATYDLWRLGKIVRRRVIDDRGLQYHYGTHNLAWNDDFHYWYDWQPDGDHAHALRVIERYAYAASMHDVAIATDWTLDHTKRIVNELWRARRLKRAKMIERDTNHWWYVYEVNSGY